MQEASRSKLEDGTEYGWATEDNEQTGCTVTVSIANWALSRSYDAVLSSADAGMEAAKMAAVLVVTIKGAN